MKITEEISITEFKPWSGAVSTVDRIINEGKADEFDNLIEEMYPDGLTSDELNDLLWFDSDWVYEMLGISENNEDEDDEDEDLEDLLDEELKDSNKKKVNDNEEFDYSKEYDLTNEKELEELFDFACDYDGKFIDDLLHASEKFEIPYKDVDVTVRCWQGVGNWYDYDNIPISFDYEIDGTDLIDYFYDDHTAYATTTNNIEKYILELAGSDTKITPAELIKRSTTERIIKFVKENDIIPEEQIQEKGEKAFENDECY